MLSISQLAEILLLVSYFFSVFQVSEDLYLLRKDHAITTDDVVAFLDNLFDFAFLVWLLFLIDTQKLERATGIRGVALSILDALLVVGICCSILYKLGEYLEKRSFSRLHLVIFSAALIAITLLVVL